MLAAIKEALGTVVLEGTGRGGGGSCINEGEVFTTDTEKVYLKKNSKPKARETFDGEYEACRVGGIRLHLHNAEAREAAVGGGTGSGYVEQFGFHINTCCGYISQDNTWADDWLVFYTRKLDFQLNLIEKEYGDREARELWSHLQLKILPQYFSGVTVFPSLLHGDLWSGNAAEVADGPVMFDPACFYGHHEYDLAIAAMFGGFPRQFWDHYHAVIPKAAGWNNRHKLYKLFHNLNNHWNHFGSGYRSSSLGLMRDLCS